MIKNVSIFFVVVSAVYSQTTWESRSVINDYQKYFHRVMQETIYELEKLGWWNLKVPDMLQTLNAEMYKWHVIGTVNYTNGFLVSIEKLELTDIAQSILTNSNTNITTADIRGILTMWIPKIGFDMEVKLENENARHYTAVIPYVLFAYTCSVQKNLNTNELSATCSNSNSRSENSRLIEYLPADNVTQVISRTFSPALVSASSWAREIFTPILLNVVTNKIEFPTICYNCLGQ